MARKPNTTTRILNVCETMSEETREMLAAFLETFQAETLASVQKENDETDDSDDDADDADSDDDSDSDDDDDDDAEEEDSEEEGPFDSASLKEIEAYFVSVGMDVSLVIPAKGKATERLAIARHNANLLASMISEQAEKLAGKDSAQLAALAAKAKLAPVIRKNAREESKVEIYTKALSNYRGVRDFKKAASEV